MNSQLRFFYNGIKDAGGKLQKCSYSDSELRNYPVGTLTIYAKNYKRFSAVVREAFAVTNDSDLQSDYFANDTIRVSPDHPLYANVKAACDAQREHYAKIAARRDAKRSPAKPATEAQRKERRDTLYTDAVDAGRLADVIAISMDSLPVGPTRSRV